MPITDNLETSYHFNSNALDSGAQGNDLTVVGATYETTSPILGSGSIKFDGINDYAHTAANPNYLVGVDHTRPLWFSCTGDGQGAGGGSQALYEDIFANGPSGGSVLTGAAMSLLNPLGGADEWFVRLSFFRSGALLGDYQHTSGSDVKNTGKHLLAYIYTHSDKTVRIFLDNLFIKELVLSDFLNTSFGRPVFGARGISSLPFEGLLDEHNTLSRAMTYGGVAEGNQAGGEMAEIWCNGNGFELGIDPGCEAQEVLMGGGLGDNETLMGGGMM